MRAYARSKIDRPSLFPFLSVLLCLIGVLMFLAAAIAPTSVRSATSNVELLIEASAERETKRPILLECTHDHAATSDGEHSFYTEAEQAALDSGEYEGGTPFTDFLADLSRKAETEYVLFIVRPAGLSTFQSLRRVVRERNRALTRCASRRLREEPAEIPDSLAKRGAEYSNARLYFEGVMTREELDVLKGLVREESSKRALEDLFDSTQTIVATVDYGTELVPTGWKIAGFAMSRTDEKEVKQ